MLHVLRYTKVMSELDSLAASLSKQATKATSLVASSTTGSSTASSRPPSTVSSGSSGLPRSIIKMPPPLPPKPGSLKYVSLNRRDELSGFYFKAFNICSSTNKWLFLHFLAKKLTSVQLWVLTRHEKIQNFICSLCFKILKTLQICFFLENIFFLNLI